MIDWIKGIFGNLMQMWAALTWNELFLFFGIFLASLLFSFVMIVIVVVNIPENYFSSHYNEDFLPDSSFLVRWGAVILKNLLGVVLIGLGILLSLPGIPGQGILTILLGPIMLDIPGKRPLEARIIKRPSVSSAIDKLRARFGKPPLVLD